MKLYVIFFILGLVCLIIEMSVLPSGVALILAVVAFALSAYEYFGKLLVLSDYLFVSILWGVVGFLWVYFLFKKRKPNEPKVTNEDINNY